MIVDYEGYEHELMVGDFVGIVPLEDGNRLSGRRGVVTQVGETVLVKLFSRPNEALEAREEVTVEPSILRKQPNTATPFSRENIRSRCASCRTRRPQLDLSMCRQCRLVDYCESTG